MWVVTRAMSNWEDGFDVVMVQACEVDEMVEWGRMMFDFPAGCCANAWMERVIYG